MNLGATRQRRQLAEVSLEKIEGKLVHKNQESSQDSKTEDENEFPISDDLLLVILILLPAASLFTMQFVCKRWSNLINTSIFIRCHAQQSETMLICNCSTSLKPCDHERDAPKHFLSLLDLADGANTFVELSVVEPFIIQVSYDGLILATAKNSNSLILMNPVTGKHVKLPLSTEHHVFLQSFGIAFCNRAKTYKIIHLFTKESGAIGCSVMSICTRCWRSIEEPCSKLAPDMRHDPVSINGSLYWLFGKEGCDYLVSLSLQDEKFVSKNLPIRGASMYQLLEIGGCLGLAMRAQPELMQVWILVSGDGGFEEKWIKKYSFSVSGFGRFPRAVCCSRNGDRIVVEKGNYLYVYNFETHEMKVIHSSLDRIWDLRRNRGHIPHRNTLVSLDDLF